MTEHRWSKFWWQDWQSEPSLRMCSLAARGLWMELLCIAHEGSPYGHVTVNGRIPTHKQLSGLAGVNETEVKKLLGELESAGVFSITDEGAIYSRRMVRDKAASDSGKEHGSRGGNPALKSKPINKVKNNPGGGGLTPPDNGKGYTLEADTESETRKERTPLPPKGASDDDPDFRQFWSLYPRKDDKGHARTAWVRALKKAEPEAILAGVSGYRFNENPRFLPLPATWLNGERWLNVVDDDGFDPVLRAVGLTPEDFADKPENPMFRLLQ